MGDTVVKKLVAEIMGKWSNIILTNKDDVILDASNTRRKVEPGSGKTLPARPLPDAPQQTKH